MTKKTQQHETTHLKITLHRLDWLEWVSIGLCIWLLFYPSPYRVVFGIVLSLPIVGLILNGISRPSLASLVSISHEKGNNKYDLADFLELPGLVILIRVLKDYEFESFYSILKVGTIGLILLMLVLILTHKRIEQTNPNRFRIYLTVFANVALYSYAATYGINCVFDNSEPKIYHAKVVEKSISRSRRQTTYNLRVTPWGHHRDAENISVSKDQYTKTEIDQTVSPDRDL